MTTHVPRTRPCAAARTALRLLAIAALPACFQYTPITPARVVPGPTEVRVELSALAADRLAARLGPDVTALDGTVRAVESDALVVAATRTLSRGGAEQGWRGESVQIPWDGVLRVRARRLDRRRTALVAIGIVGGAALAARAAGTGFSLSGNGRGGTGPER